MQPKDSREFLKAAQQRLDAAEALLGQKYTLDAQYLGGYAVECALKALILEGTVDAERPGVLKKISSGAKMHRPEVLLGELADRGYEITADLAGRIRKMKWKTELRYETGRRDTGETIAFLKTAKTVIKWVLGEFP